MKWFSILSLALLFSASARAEAVDVRKLINDAITAKQAKVVIPEGKHYIKPLDPNAPAHMVFEGAENLEIDGTGATLVFTDPEKNGIYFNHCKGLILRGFKIDYDPLPFTQGTITAVDAAGFAYTIKIDDGYLTNPTYFTGSDQSFTGGRMAAYMFDGQSGKWKTDAFDMYPSKFELVDPLTVRLSFATAESFNRNNGVVGDRIVVSRRSSSAIRMNFCENSNVDGITIYSCGGIGMHEASGNGGNRFKLTVTRGPAPAGATAPRMHSINADGFHSSAVKKGPIVEDSLFEWMGDDSIAIHGTYALVTAQPAPDQITLSPKFEMPFEIGDDLTIVDSQTYKVKATAKVTKTESVAATEDPAVAKLWETYRVDQKGRKFFTVSVDRPTAVAVGDLITSPQRVGNGYVIRNNTCRFHRARGIQIKAGDGVIENNVVEDVNFAGITLGPELSIWLGSDYVRNVVVRNNTIRGTGRGGEGRKNANFADIAAIAVRSLTLDRQLSPPENTNIVIEGNKIESPAGLAMFLSSATNMTVKGNTITAPWALGPNIAGKRFGVDPAAAIFVAGVEGVAFDGNTIDLAGGTATKAVATGKDANAVTGIESGFTLKAAAAAARAE